MDLQQLILKLQDYWASGCLIWQPYDIEKGAGTMNPATFAGPGPEPWAVAYVEPSRRPTDGRYGETRTGFTQHLQYQVVISRPRRRSGLYLQSLAHLGLTCNTRFVEDNWESPPWGLGPGLKSGWTGWRSPSLHISSRWEAST